MAPDLNSVPASPRGTFRSLQTSAPSSRRASQLMGPPPAPATAPVQAATRDSTMSLSHSSISAVATAADNTGVGTGPGSWGRPALVYRGAELSNPYPLTGPLRHPRPLTAADLHLQLEKEQEAVVNRLTRELSLLRQQSASVASTASSTSTGLADLPDSNQSHVAFAASHPTPSRRHRSSSSLSTRSINTTGNTTSTISAIAPMREGTPYLSSHNRDSLSRHNSVASSRRSEAPSPSLSTSLVPGDHFPFPQSRRQSYITPHSHPSVVHIIPQPISPGEARSPTRTSAIFSMRYEEATRHRAELEAAKEENEILRHRIRELERSLGARHQPSSSRRRGETAGRTTEPDADGS